MDAYLKSECSHCGQAIEYPAAGTGQTVACPTCGQFFVLTPIAPSVKTAAPSLPEPSEPVMAPSFSQPDKAPTAGVGRFDEAYLEFARDRAFEQHPPSREQVARAWALAHFKNPEATGGPRHDELVAALGEIFPEFSPAKPANRHARPK